MSAENCETKQRRTTSIKYEYSSMYAQFVVHNLQGPRIVSGIFKERRVIFGNLRMVPGEFRQYDQ